MGKVNYDSKLWQEAVAASDRLKKYWEYTGKHPREEPVKLKRRKKPKTKRQLQKAYWATKPYYIYALELEHGCYYVGISKHVESRYRKHCAGKGAQWTALHPPVRIIETRLTKICIESDAAKLEDELTFEYAKKYGKDFVRGGGYCQTKPRWPSHVDNHLTGISKPVLF